MKITISKEWFLRMAQKEEGLEIGAGNPNFERDVYDAWFEELKRVAFLNGFSKSALETFDKEAWKSYFDDNLSPAEALSEDLGCA